MPGERRRGGLPGGPARRRPAETVARQPGLVGRRGRRLLRRARRLPRRRRLRLGPGGPARGRARTCSATLDGMRVLEIGAGAAPVLALARRARARAVVATRPVRRACCARARRINATVADATAARARSPQCDGAALPFADARLRRRLHGIRRRCRSSPTPARVHGARRPGCCGPGGRFVFSTTHPVRWAFPDDPGPSGLTATPVLLRPHAVRRAGRRGAGDLRRAPPHARRPGARDRRGRARARRPRRAGVAGGATSSRGAAGRRCAGALIPGHGDLRLPPRLTDPLRPGCSRRR